MADALYTAIMCGNFEEFDRLIASGANPVDVTPSEKWNYLHRAFLIIDRSPPVAMIERLIQGGAQVNAVDDDGSTPLHYAAYQKSPEAADIVKLLVAAGADVNVLNRRHISPLRRSIGRLPIDLEIVRTLLGAGADMHEKNAGGRSVKEMVERMPAGTDELRSLFR
jgi:ankyrin repeat protein